MMFLVSIFSPFWEEAFSDLMESKDLLLLQYFKRGLELRRKKGSVTKSRNALSAPYTVGARPCFPANPNEWPKDSIV
jgi:hypothetical protein